MAVAKALPACMIDSLLSGYKKDYEKHEDVAGKSGLLKRKAAANTSNARKTLKDELGKLPVEIFHYHHDSPEPQPIARRQLHWSGLDEKILSLYTRGMTVHEIQGCLEETYGIEISPTLISSVTDVVADEVRAWQFRPLSALYPIVYLDCIHVKVRDADIVRAKAIYLALGINMAGEKELLGIWGAETEGAKFWLQAITELKSRGVQDISIACVDGLKGLPETIETIYPKTAVQLCIVHLVRYSLNYVNRKLRKEVALDLRAIYAASTVEEAELRLGEFEHRWGAVYPPIIQSWRSNWARIIPFFGYPPEIRKVIYTTNAIETVNTSLRKIVRSRGTFSSDESLLTLFYLALNKISKKWMMPARDRKVVLDWFAIQFKERHPA